MLNFELKCHLLIEDLFFSVIETLPKNLELSTPLSSCPKIMCLFPFIGINSMTALTNRGRWFAHSCRSVLDSIKFRFLFFFVILQINKTLNFRGFLRCIIHIISKLGSHLSDELHHPILLPGVHLVGTIRDLPSNLLHKQ